MSDRDSITSNTPKLAHRSINRRTSPLQTGLAYPPTPPASHVTEPSHSPREAPTSPSPTTPTLSSGTTQLDVRHNPPKLAVHSRTIWVLSAMLSFLGVTAAVAAIWPAYKGEDVSEKAYQLAQWTARKDFIEHCKARGASQPISVDCEQAITAGLPAPPGLFERGLVGMIWHEPASFLGDIRQRFSYLVVVHWAIITTLTTIALVLVWNARKPIFTLFTQLRLSAILQSRSQNKPAPMRPKPRFCRNRQCKDVYFVSTRSLQKHEEEAHGVRSGDPGPSRSRSGKERIYHDPSVTPTLSLSYPAPASSSSSLKWSGGHYNGEEELRERESLPSQATLGTWFISGEGIAEEVIRADLQRYLGPDAEIESYRSHDPKYEAVVDGYWITAYRPFTLEMLKDLRADSAAWLQQKGGQSPTAEQAQTTTYSRADSPLAHVQEHHPRMSTTARPGYYLASDGRYYPESARPQKVAPPTPKPGMSYSAPEALQTGYYLASDGNYYPYDQRTATRSAPPARQAQAVPSYGHYLASDGKHYLNSSDPSPIGYTTQTQPQPYQPYRRQ